MFTKIKHHYTRSLQVHRLLHLSMVTPKLNDKLEALRQVKETQSDYDEGALPRWVEKTVEWYVGNVVPALVPFGNHRANFLRRIALALRGR